MKGIKRRILGVAVRMSLIMGMTACFYGAAHGYELTPQFSMGGVLAGAYQFELGGEGHSGGALPFQPEFSFRPWNNHEIFLKFGFAAGNGLSGKSPFVLAPWAADLEDDVKHIHGRNRDYLLTAWYRFTLEPLAGHTIGITGGIIDATDYLDENAFANDEYTQFMNEALVNGPNGFAPSYDVGGALEWEYGPWSAKGVGMNVGENEAGNNYNFFGLQAGYKLNTSLGEGNYRLIYEGSPNEAFLDPDGITLGSRHALLISFDQAFGDVIGGWIRFGTQIQIAMVDYAHIYSGGLNISGNLWGRGQDNLGIGYGYLSGGNTGVRQTQVAEAYARFGFMEYFAVTLDLQYMEDRFDPGAGENMDGWIAGIRFAMEY